MSHVFKSDIKVIRAAEAGEYTATYRDVSVACRESELIRFRCCPGCGSVEPWIHHVSCFPPHARRAALRIERCDNCRAVWRAE